MDPIRQTNTDYYNKNAVRWSTTKTDSFFHEEGFRKLVNNLKEGDSVIDIGCAYGIHVPLFLGIGRHLKYEGFDISEKMIEIAKSHYPQIIFGTADILDRESLPKKKFNAFWAVAVLMHIPKVQWNEMFDNIENLVLPGSYGYFTLPTVRPGEASEEDQRHFTLIEDTELFDFLEKRNWQLLDKGGFKASVNKAIWRWYIVKVP